MDYVFLLYHKFILVEFCMVVSLSFFLPWIGLYFAHFYKAIKNRQIDVCAWERDTNRKIDEERIPHRWIDENKRIGKLKTKNANKITNDTVNVL